MTSTTHQTEKNMRRFKQLILIGPLVALTLARSVGAQETTTPPAAGAAATTPPPALAEAPPVAATKAARGTITGPPLGGPTVWGLLDWWGVGAGARYMFPLGIPSLLTRTPFKDSWALEAGLDFLHRSDDYGPYSFHYNELIPTVGVMWLFWLRDDFALYPKVDGGWAFGFGNSVDNCVGCSLGGIWIEGAGGLLYKAGPVTLRAELGNYGVKGGVAWLF
jgi:hypothetical protein